MFLGMISSIKEYFANIGNTSLVDLIPFILGLILGFILCLLIYLLVFVTSFRKKNNDQKEIIEIDDEIIKQKIDNVKNQFIDEASSKKTSEKISTLKEASWNLINDIAKVYYPDSDHPIYELSIEELISLDYYIMNRIESIFSGKVLSRIKKLKISSILSLLDMKKKYEENKLVKAANKINLSGIAKAFISVINIVNPVYWVKKVMIDVPFQMILNKIALTLINVIGVQTGKIYSKKVFTESEKNIDEQVKEIEQMLGEENYESKK